jgi:hypothetical protein
MPRPRVRLLWITTRSEAWIWSHSLGVLVNPLVLCVVRDRASLKESIYCNKHHCYCQVRTGCTTGFMASSDSNVCVHVCACVCMCVHVSCCVRTKTVGARKAHNWQRPRGDRAGKGQADQTSHFVRKQVVCAYLHDVLAVQERVRHSGELRRVPTRLRSARLRHGNGQRGEQGEHINGLFVVSRLTEQFWRILLLV